MAMLKALFLITIGTNQIWYGFILNDSKDPEHFEDTSLTLKNIRGDQPVGKVSIICSSSKNTGSRTVDTVLVGKHLAIEEVHGGTS